MRSLSFLVVQTQHHTNEVREANELKVHTAVLLPIVGSIMLVALFYFLDQLSILLVIIFSFSSFVSITYALAPAFGLLARKLRLAPDYQYVTAEVLFIERGRRSSHVSRLGCCLSGQNAFPHLQSWALQLRWLLSSPGSSSASGILPIVPIAPLPTLCRSSG